MIIEFTRRRVQGKQFYTDINIELKDPYRYEFHGAQFESTCVLVTDNKYGGFIQSNSVGGLFAVRMHVLSKSFATADFRMFNGDLFARMIAREDKWIFGDRIFEIKFERLPDSYVLHKLPINGPAIANEVFRYQFWAKERLDVEITFNSVNRLYSFFDKSNVKGHIQTDIEFDLIQIACFLQVVQFFEYHESNNI